MNTQDTITISNFEHDQLRDSSSMLSQIAGLVSPYCTCSETTTLEATRNAINELHTTRAALKALMAYVHMLHEKEQITIAIDDMDD